MRTRFRRKGWLCAVLVIVLCFTLALPQMNSLARTYINMDADCSLTLTLDDSVLEEFEDLNTAEIKAHVFLVATVDTYGRFTVLPKYEDLFELNVENGATSAATAKAWEEKAREIAGKLGLPVPEVKQEQGDAAKPDAPSAGTSTETPDTAEGTQNGTSPETPDTSGETPDATPSVTPGQGEQQEAFDWTKQEVTGKEAFSITLPKGAPEGTAKKETTKTIGTDPTKKGMYLVCVENVETDEYVYEFLPYLVAVPNNYYRAEDPTSVDAWIYNVKVGLKPQRDIRYLDLEIQKDLPTYNASLGEAMFIFQVDARKNGELVYSKVLTLNFKDPGKLSAIAKHIPAGSIVTVEERYAGSAYQISGESKKEITLLENNRLPGGDASDEVAPVVFQNDYTGKLIYGTGVVNHYEYGSVSNADGNVNITWSGKQLEDSRGEEVKADENQATP